MSFVLGKCKNNKLDLRAIEDHVTSIDIKLYNEYKDNRFSKKYIELIEKRGFTFLEYLSLFDLTIKKEDFHNHKIFQFLKIEEEYGFQISEDRIKGRKDFTNTYTPDREGYVLLLSRTAKKQFIQSDEKDYQLESLNGHVHITGQTGSGKSQLMRLLFWNIHKQALRTKTKSAILIDIHGDLAKQIKSFKLNKDNQRLIYFSSQLKPGCSPVINPLYVSDRSLINKTTEFLVEAFDEMLNDQSLSDQMRTILVPCIRTLLVEGNKDLSDLQRFMIDDNELINLGINSDFKSHSDFFKSKFRDKTYSRTKNAIYSRIQNLLNYPLFFNMTVGENTIDLSKEMNQGKVIVFDLSGLGSLSKEAMGRFLIAQIKAVAENRESIEEELRPETYLFIDEAQNFLTRSIENTLNEMRKFKLYLILAHQYLKQLHDLLFPVMSNTLTKIVFYNDDSSLNNLTGYLGLSLDEMKDDWRPFECWVKEGRRSSVKVKPSSHLIDNAQYLLSSVSEAKLNDWQVDNYYRDLSSTNSLKTQSINDQESNINSPEPLYKLYLGALHD